MAALTQATIKGILNVLEEHLRQMDLIEAKVVELDDRLQDAEKRLELKDTSALFVEMNARLVHLEKKNAYLLDRVRVFDSDKDRDL